MNKIKAIAQAAAKNQGKSFTFKCKTKELYNQVFAQLFTVSDDCYDVVRYAAKVDKNIITNSYSYLYDDNIWTITVKFKFK